jgi:hypothetical protein
MLLRFRLLKCNRFHKSIKKGIKSHKNLFCEKKLNVSYLFYGLFVFIVKIPKEKRETDKTLFPVDAHNFGMFVDSKLKFNEEKFKNSNVM